MGVATIMLEENLFSYTVQGCSACEVVKVMDLRVPTIIPVNIHTRDTEKSYIWVGLLRAEEGCE